MSSSRRFTINPYLMRWSQAEAWGGELEGDWEMRFYARPRCGDRVELRGCHLLQPEHSPANLTSVWLVIWESARAGFQVVCSYVRRSGGLRTGGCREISWSWRRGVGLIRWRLWKAAATRMRGRSCRHYGWIEFSLAG